MSITLGKAYVLINGDNKGLKKALGESEKGTIATVKRLGSTINTSLGNVAKKVVIGVGAAVAAGAAAVTAFGVSAVDAAADAEEMLSKFEYTFGAAADGVSADLTQFAKDAGRSRYELQEMAADMGAVLKGMGLTEDSAAGLSTQMAELAVDVGSFNNMQASDVQHRFIAGLTGEYESLKALGIVINQARLEQELLNMGVEGGAEAGTRAFSGLSVEADGGTGNTVRLARAYRNLLEVCREIAAVGGGDMAVVGTGAAQFEFRWYEDQLGTDRSATVILAMERGNMAQPRLSVSRLGEVNAVEVGGQGQGSDRETVWRTDATRMAASTWNRCERFADARNESETEGLQDKGDAFLSDGEPKRELAFGVLQTPGCEYRADYGLGDLVTARFAGVTETRKVAAVRFRVNQDGEEIDVETEAT